MAIPNISEEQRELLLFDALRVTLGFVHGAEREQVRLSLRGAGLVRFHAPDGCESWHWPGHAPLGSCRHGYALEQEKPL